MPLSFIVVVALGAGPDAAKVNFKDQVAAIFQQHCNGCHNNDKQKGGLSLDTFGNAMKGGSSGKVIEPGDAAGSRLYELTSHAGEPKMPPKTAKIPDAELAILKQWIEAGAPETSGSAPVAAKPKMDFKLDPSAIGKPVGPPAMPEGVSTDPIAVTAKPNAVTAMAASPWAPLVAISGQKQVLLYNTQNRRLAAVLPFPEGTIHVLKFTRDGGVLLAAGGRGGQSGRAVAWDVKTGKRLFEIGKEYDAVLAADISPDRSLVALGGPSKVLKVFSTSDGEVVYESKKHTEWVTAIEFSPDGVLLASGDRNGGLVVWEAATGREFYDLRGHQTAITDVSWRLDSNLLASASEDTTVRLWEMQNGTQAKAFGTHGGGALSVRFAKDGRLITAGRDRTSKLWDQNGGQKRVFEAFPDLATRAVFLHDDAFALAADWSGEVRIFDLNQDKRVANLAANPPALATRLSLSQQAWTIAQAASDAAAKEMETLRADVEAKFKAVGATQDAVAQAEKVERDAVATLSAADTLARDKGNAEQASHAVAWSADFVRGLAWSLRDEAEKARVGLMEAVKQADELAALTKDERDKMLADKAKAAFAAASKLAEEANARVNSTVEAAKVARTAADKATAERLASTAPLDALRTSAQQAAGAVPARKAELRNATTAREASEKAVVAKLPAAQDFAARAKLAKEEVEALATEKAASDAGRASAMASPR